MKLEDVLGIGKVLPIDKLIEIVSNSVGRISKPYFDRKDIDTKVYEIKKIAEARAEEMKIISNAVKENFEMTGGIEYKDEKIAINSPKELQPQLLLNESIEERTKERIIFQETKRQLNIENVTAFAAEELKNEQPITDEPIDEDWTSRFFKIVEDISNEEMQTLWGRILAGEIKQPKTYSLRTLELIRNLSKNEADVFTKVANYAIKFGTANYLFKGDDEELLSKNYNISYTEIALLMEIGLIQTGDTIIHQLLQRPTDSQMVYTGGNIVIIAKTKANTPTIQVPVFVFSTTGNELLKLIKSIPPFDYLTLFAKSLKNKTAEVKYAYILGRTGTIINHTQPLQEFPNQE
ncbi:DUF2806 domain-containing protein [Flavobacterium sp.]|uniref:DUF2806 domain-containing protein n=1 Tax=Flavobacterium sp. TaxID=239 RepID=UPI000ED06D37|nr:DUF2806 domain-containing protein [Flavobacterium sp.]HCQ12872.1 hypothetical protein [Flavobacterium sp.]